MIEPIIWMYWDGVKHPYIKYCENTVKKRSGCEVRILDNKSVRQYLTDGVDIHPRWKEITWTAQRADIIRISLLYKYGGVWVDSDTVMLRPIGDLLNRKSDILCMKWKRTGRILNGYFLAQKGSKFLSYGIEYCNRILTNKFKNNYSEHGGVLFGECLFNEIHSEHKELIEFIGLETFIPIEFPFDQKIWYRSGRVENHIKKYTIAIGLNNSQYPLELKQRQVSSIMKMNNLLGNIFIYSEKIDTSCNGYTDGIIICPKCGHEFGEY